MGRYRLYASLHAVAPKAGDEVGQESEDLIRELSFLGDLPALRVAIREFVKFDARLTDDH
jgi:hypothetical protein